MGACRIKQERPCDGCVSSSAGNLQLRRRHDHGSHWLPAKPIRAECCSNKLFIIISRRRGGRRFPQRSNKRPCGGTLASPRQPRHLRRSNTVLPSFRATTGSRHTKTPPTPLWIEAALASLSLAIIISRMALVDALYERSTETCLCAESRLEEKLNRPAAAGGGGAMDSPASRQTAGASCRHNFFLLLSQAK